MAVRVIRLGTPRAPGEGVRIGTVRRPPRGVPREEFASRDFYDVWLPELAPSQELVTRAHQATSEDDWEGFRAGYRHEMAAPAARHLVQLLAAWSRTGDLAVGCYCEDERHCHRSVLRELLADAGATVVG
jgi:uncharacterized protein YeaO (DUF488 family)